MAEITAYCSVEKKKWNEIQFYLIWSFFSERISASCAAQTTQKVNNYHFPHRLFLSELHFFWCALEALHLQNWYEKVQTLINKRFEFICSHFNLTAMMILNVSDEFSCDSIFKFKTVKIQLLTFFRCLLPSCFSHSFNIQNFQNVRWKVWRIRSVLFQIIVTLFVCSKIEIIFHINATGIYCAVIYTAECAWPPKSTERSNV